MNGKVTVSNRWSSLLSTQVTFMNASILSNWTRSYLAYFNFSALARFSTRDDPGNKFSCVANIRSDKYPRRFVRFENIHNEWLISNGTGHTGRNSESRSIACGCGDNQRTTAKTTLSWVQLRLTGWVKLSGTIIPVSTNSVTHIFEHRRQGDLLIDESQTKSCDEL